jgi:hypothetical protein
LFSSAGSAGFDFDDFETFAMGRDCKRGAKV